MSTLQEIQQAIEELPLSERSQLAKWFNGWEDDEWDQQMYRDFSKGGRYEQVPKRIQSEIEKGPLLDLP